MSPFSAAERLCIVLASTEPALPNKEPSVGIKINAIINDDERTAINVIGRNFINSPIISGQKASGINAVNVVQVEAIIGQDILLAAAA